MKKSKFSQVTPSKKFSCKEKENISAHQQMLSYKFQNHCRLALAFPAQFRGKTGFDFTPSTIFCPYGNSIKDVHI